MIVQQTQKLELKQRWKPLDKLKAYSYDLIKCAFSVGLSLILKGKPFMIDMNYYRYVVEVWLIGKE